MAEAPWPFKMQECICTVFSKYLAVRDLIFFGKWWILAAFFLNKQFYLALYFLMGEKSADVNHTLTSQVSSIWDLVIYASKIFQSPLLFCVTWWK